jgi:uncharacterized membrane protein
VITRTLLVKCLACGVVSRVEVATETKVANVAIEHEDGCPYFSAIDEGREAALKWVEAHGYPITSEVAS